MNLLPLTWIEKSIDRRVNAWCQKNRWTKLRINGEGLWVAIPPGETEHMEVPPIAYVSQSQLKLRAIRPYLPFIAFLTVMAAGYVDLSWQLRTARRDNQNLSQQLRSIGQDIQAIKRNNTVPQKPVQPHKHTQKTHVQNQQHKK
jgi:hypothetical protein